MAHIHEVKDTELSFLIDPLTRRITPRDKGKTTIVQYDHNSEELTFEIPRYVDAHDMMTCNKIEVHFLNVGEKETNKGVYIVNGVEKITDAETGTEKVKLRWCIAQSATMLKGRLDFLIRFMCVANNTIDYAWNTAIYTGLTVDKGIDNGEAILTDYVDVLEAWKQEVIDKVSERERPTDSAMFGQYKAVELYNSTVNFVSTVKQYINDGMADMSQYHIDLMAGEMYVVNWNGTEHLCVCKSFSGVEDGNSITIYYVGNLALADISNEDTGEDFCISVGYINGEWFSTAFNKREYGTENISVRVTGRTGIDYVINLTADSDGYAFCDKPFSKIITAYTNGFNLKANMTVPITALGMSMYMSGTPVTIASSNGTPAGLLAHGQVDAGLAMGEDAINIVTFSFSMDYENNVFFMTDLQL